MVECKRCGDTNIEMLKWRSKANMRQARIDYIIGVVKGRLEESRPNSAINLAITGILKDITL